MRTEPRQATLARAVELRGVGLHSGKPCAVALAPSDPNTGVAFEVSGVLVPATLESVCECVRCTGLSCGAARIDTVEHLLAALWASGVDNAIIRVEGPEIPAMDGSARPATEAVRQAGLEPQNAPRRALELPRPVYVETGPARGIALPAERFHATVAVEFPHPVGRQVVDFPDALAAFSDRIAPARTPGFASEWEKLKAHGLALGASEDNVLPILDDRYAAPERVESEVATHKTLDLIGDLALLGAELRAHVITTHGGHALNHALAREIRDASIAEA